MNSSFFLAAALYFAVLLTIGIYSYLQQKRKIDFLLGNRTLNYYVTAIATNATDMSLWLYMGYPAFIYIHGLSGIWIGVGLCLGMFATWHYVAPALRKQSEELDAYTITEFFDKKFHDKLGILTLISALFALIFFTYYISSGIVALGRFFSVVFDLPYSKCISMGTGITALYTLLGGFLAVGLNNFFQGILMLVAIMLVPIVAFGNLESINQLTLAAQQQQVSLTPIPDYSYATISAIILSILSWGLSCFGQLHILVNFMAIRKTQELRKAKYISTGWNILALGFATLTGIISLAYFKQGTMHPELLFINLTKILFSPFLTGIILCAVLAAGISTIAMQILLSASTIAHDLFKKFIFPKASEQQMGFVYRYAIFCVSIISWYLALDNTKEILELVRHAWIGLGSSFGPLILLALFGRNITYHGASAGILVGGILTLLQPVICIDARLPFILSFITICVVSAINRLHYKKT